MPDSQMQEKQRFYVSSDENLRILGYKPGAFTDQDQIELDKAHRIMEAAGFSSIFL